jgi:hypothetical protein
MSIEMIAGVLVMAGTVALALWRSLSKEGKEAQDKRLATLKAGFSVVYHLVDEVARLTPTQVDDKAAFALGKLNEWLQAQGLPAMSGPEKVLASMAFTAMHGAEKKAEALASP